MKKQIAIEVPTLQADVLEKHEGIYFTDGKVVAPMKGAEPILSDGRPLLFLFAADIREFWLALKPEARGAEAADINDLQVGRQLFGLCVTHIDYKAGRVVLERQLSDVQATASAATPSSRG